jgi:hypothetical protein
MNMTQTSMHLLSANNNHSLVSTSGTCGNSDNILNCVLIKSSINRPCTDMAAYHTMHSVERERDTLTANFPKPIT